MRGCRLVLGALGCLWLLPAHPQAAPPPAPLALSSAAGAAPRSVQSVRGAQSTQSVARVIVKYRSDDAAEAAPAKRAQRLGQRLSLTLRSGRSLSARSQVLMVQGLDSHQLAHRLARDPAVEYAVVDERRRRVSAPNDPLYASGPALSGTGSGGPVAGQWYLRAPDNVVKASINAEPAWALSTGSPSIVVAVLDTGVRFDHADFMRSAAGGNLLDGFDFVSNDFVGNDGNPGRDADGTDPGDWVSSGDVASSANTIDCSTGDIGDSSWHGTQVTGLIGALTDNGVGMASLGRNVQVLPVRVLGKCGGYDSDIIAGMRWAAGLQAFNSQNQPLPLNPNKARVLNLSLGGTGACSAAYAEAVTEINAVGAVVVAAAGNSAGHAVKAPANCPGVIGVAGLRHVGSKVGFSDLGPEITISAPAGNCVNIGLGDACLYPIVTTRNSGTTVPVAGVAGSVYSDSFDATLGTSFSAPLVSGTVALMLSVQPLLTPAEVKQLLQTSARDFPASGADNGSDPTPVPLCVAPTLDANRRPVDQLQCYCTQATCGAGMLDAGAAVQAARDLSLGLRARITVAPANSVAAQAVTLSAITTDVPTGRTLVSYLWEVTDDGDIVSGPSSASNAASFSVTPTGAGRFTVSLTVTDDQGARSIAMLSVDVIAAPAPPDSAPTPTPAASGGGGGALGLPWLLALLAGVAALRRRRCTHLDTRRLR